jgi:hypothetical protein
MNIILNNNCTGLLLTIVWHLTPESIGQPCMDWKVQSLGNPDCVCPVR